MCATSVVAQPQASAATGSSGRPLTMQQAVTAAVQTHPSLRSARSRVQQAGANINTAQSAYYPSVSAGVNSQWNDDRMTGYRGDTLYEAQLSVNQLLYDFGQTGSKVERAEAKQAVAQTRVGLAYASVVRQTAKAWLRVKQYRALATVAADQLEAIKGLAQLAHKREGLGASTHSDTTQANARVESARAQLLRTRGQTRRWRTELMQWIGANKLPHTRGKPAPILAGACRVGNSRTASHQAVSVQVAREQLAVAQAGAEVAAKQLWPTVSLEATASHGLGSQSQRINGDDTDYTLMLDMSVPLFQGGRLRSSKQAAAYGATAARSALQEARVAAERGLQSAVTQWQRYKGLQAIQKQRENSMRVTRRLYRDQYLQLGTRSLLDLLNAEQEYYGVLSDQISNKYIRYRLAVDCLYYGGGLQQVAAAAAAPGSRWRADNSLRFPGVPDLGGAADRADNLALSPADGLRRGSHE